MVAKSGLTVSGLELTMNDSNPAVTAGQGQEGLRDFSWTVTFLPSRARQLIVRGLYTRLGAVDAFAQYQAEIDERVDDVQAFLGSADGSGLWDLIGENSDLDNDLDLDDFGLFQAALSGP